MWRNDVARRFLRASKAFPLLLLAHGCSKASPASDSTPASTETTSESVTGNPTSSSTSSQLPGTSATSSTTDSPPGDHGPGSGGTAGGTSTNGDAPSATMTSTGTAAGGSDGSGTAGTARGGSGVDSGGVGNDAGSGNLSGSAGAVAGSGGSPAVTGVVLDGTDLIVDGVPFHIRGVGWNPVGRGQNHPQGIDYAGFAPIDIPLMQAAGINAVRTYEPLLDVTVLDQLYDAGIYVLNSVYPYGGDAASVVSERVNAVKNHPAMLIWLLGNEWNYNGLYVELPHAEAQARLNEAAALVRQADTAHPIATVYGELPDAAVIAAMPDIDVWGINAYRGIGFGALFDDWAARSGKPMFLAEYGADAYNANLGQYDPESQAEAVRALTQEIADHASAFGAGVAVGGALFEWADEWWKDPAGALDEQDVGGIAPGGGPHPDQVFNEEWWGIVDIDRNPRPAYDALAEVFAGLP